MWPYEYYKSIEEIICAIEFPAISTFSKKSNGENNFLDEFCDVCENLIKVFSRYTCFADALTFFGIESHHFTKTELADTEHPMIILKEVQNCLKVSPLAYSFAKLDYIDKLNSGNFCSMYDQLKFYNITDCELLAKAWAKYTESFYHEYNVDPFLFMSLSQLAESIMFMHYPDNCMPMITFPNEYTWLNQEIRQFGIKGGLSACFKRHAQIKFDAKYPDTVFKVPNGRRVALIEQLGKIS
jgi:hypothetical protein